MLNKIKNVTIVLMFFLSISVSGCIFEEKKEEKKWMTAKEFYEMKETQSLNLSKYNSIYIKDKVVKVVVIKIPKINHWEGNFTVFPNISLEYTLVGFESTNQISIFIGNKTKDFSLNEVVELELPVKEYNVTIFGDETYFLVEPIYGTIQFSMYRTVISGGIFFPLTITKRLIENNTKYIFTVENITEFHPLPLKWSKVIVGIPYLDEHYSNKIFPTPKIELYDFQGNFIGNIGNTTNLQKDKLIEKGDYLIFDYLQEYNSTKSTLRFYYPSIKIPETNFWWLEEEVFWWVEL